MGYSIVSFGHYGYLLVGATLETRLLLNIFCHDANDTWCWETDSKGGNKQRGKSQKTHFSSWLVLNPNNINCL